VATYIGINWADQKHDVILRSASEPAKVEHSQIAHEPDALMEWLGELQRRFAGKGKILVSLEQGSRCADLSFDGLRVLGTLSDHRLDQRPLRRRQIARIGKLIHPTTILHAFSDRS
jgi:hypothetical protein